MFRDYSQAEQIRLYTGFLMGMLAMAGIYFLYRARNLVDWAFLFGRGRKRLAEQDNIIARLERDLISMEKSAVLRDQHNMAQVSALQAALEESKRQIREKNESINKLTAATGGRGGLGEWFVQQSDLYTKKIAEQEEIINRLKGQLNGKR